MSDIKDTLDAMRAGAPQKAAKKEPVEAPVPADLQKMAVLAACYAALMEVPCEREVAEKFGVTLPAFLHHYAGSIVVPIIASKEHQIAGAMWFKDGQVHLAVRRQYRGGRWVTRLRELFAPGFRAFGDKLVAQINKRNLVARRFTERIGGKRVGEAELALIYELEKDSMVYWKGNDYWREEYESRSKA